MALLQTLAVALGDARSVSVVSQLGLQAYVGTKENHRERETSVTGWGVKIRLQGGGHFEQTGRG